MKIRPTILRTAGTATAVIILAGCATMGAGTPQKAGHSAGAAVAPGSGPSVTVTPNISGPISVGASFYVTVKGVEMPKNDGATLGLKWNELVVDATGVELAPGSPFDFLGAPTVKRFTFAHTDGNICEQGPCSFDAVRITFTALAAGNAEIAVFEDGHDKCWGDPVTEKCFASPPGYPPTEITVALPPPDQPK